MEPQERYDTADAIIGLAKDLGLRYDPSMQDWPYEVADINSVAQYVEYYRVLTDDDKKFTLMKMMIQALEEQSDIKVQQNYWNIIKDIIIQDFSIHQYTLYYWCVFDNNNIDENWFMCPYCRSLWAEING